MAPSGDFTMALDTLSGWLNHQILADVDATERTIEEIVAYVVTEDYDGFDLDLDGVRPDDRAAFSAFTARLGGTP